MTRALHSKSSKDGLTARAYSRDGAVMVAFDLDSHQTKDLAGFAVKVTPPGKGPSYLLNRLNFAKGIHAKTTPAQRVWTPSNVAPFQKFRWVDFPPDVIEGKYHYEVSAMYFRKGDTLKPGPTVDLEVQVGTYENGPFEMGFTRGYMSSQAYAAKFKNADIRPKGKKTLDYNTKPFQKQYEWLGFHARKMVFDFLNECLKDKSIAVDLFAYDLDEPDFVRGLVQLGTRLRAFLDNAPLHTKAGAVEPKAKAALLKSAGANNVKIGHFKRFAHNKVMIQKKDGKPVKVLTGSANFSVRGLYVQANNILVFDDPVTSQLYGDAFDQAFNDPTKRQAHFAASSVAKEWFDVKESGLPQFSVCFSPHESATTSLSKVAQAISRAASSVMFAVMELGGGGPVLQELQSLPTRGKIFSYGVTQAVKGMKLYKPGSSSGLLVPFGYLQSKVPAPFSGEFEKETSGGMGQVIHDKFVVVDFNDASPVVFTGSSNLAAGGETSNGDNLLAIYDSGVATAYGVEAVRLVDHYHFRAAIKGATQAKPLVLKPAGVQRPWWKPYYDPKDIKCHERLLFVRSLAAAAVSR